jgi:adenosylmethionine-8-amino-7-oxononanoate aminotransferase
MPKVPLLASGEGCTVTAADGTRYLDGLSALYCAQLGYGRDDLVEAATAQMRRLPFATNWSVAHQPAIDLAAAIAARFPGDVDHVFFVNSGSEAVESAMKLALQYHRLNGEDRTKFISRMHAYHGTTFGALSITGIPALRQPFEPLRSGHFHAPNTNPYRCIASQACPPCDLACARSLEQIVLAEGPDQIAAIVVEPVQNAGGSFTPPEGYLDEVRRICDTYGILMVSDEVICGFGRLGEWTGAELYGVTPDLITFAKGVTVGLPADGRRGVPPSRRRRVAAGPVTDVRPRLDVGWSPGRRRRGPGEHRGVRGRRRARQRPGDGPLARRGVATDRRAPRDRWRPPGCRVFLGRRTRT